MAVVTMKVFCEDCDVEDVKKELSKWYFSDTSIGMNGLFFEVDR